MDLPRHHLVEVGISAEVEVSAPTVGVEIVVAEGPALGAGALEAETVAVLAGQPLVRHDLVENPCENGVIEHDLRGTAHGVPLFRRQGLRFLHQLVLMFENRSQLVIAQKPGKADPPLDVEGVSLSIGHGNDRQTVSVRRRQQLAVHSLPFSQVKAAIRAPGGRSMEVVRAGARVGKLLLQGGNNAQGPCARRYRPP